MTDAFNTGAPAVSAAPGDMPEVLAVPVRLNVRNSEQHVDAAGKATHLNGNGLAAEISGHVAVGTVLFTTLFLDSINTSVRGLARVRSAATGPGGESCEIVADWVDLNTESRAKIERLLSGSGPQYTATLRGNIIQHSAQSHHYDPEAYQHGVAHTGDVGRFATEKKRYFEPSPMRPIGKPTSGTRLSQSLGVTAYIAIILIVLAVFPVTRNVELRAWDGLVWGLTHLWYWASHINQVRLYNNT
jgi:hypothetical protein